MSAFEFTSGMNTMLTSESGLVGDYMSDLGAKVERVAKVYAPVSSGRLRGAIAWRWSGNGLEVEVVANTSYALAVHKGTKPHVITPNRAKVLRFPAKGGGVVFTNRVNHPGTKGVPFLTDALVAVL